jgi:protoporphyrinogen oxidase
MDRTIVIGAGPAGLAAAHELSELGRQAVVLEQDDQVGGIARTVVYRGYRFDIGGHRFFTKAAIQELWEEIMGTISSSGPGSPASTTATRSSITPSSRWSAHRTGPIEAIRIFVSYVRARAFPSSTSGRSRNGS